VRLRAAEPVDTAWRGRVPRLCLLSKTRCQETYGSAGTLETRSELAVGLNFYRLGRNLNRAGGRTQDRSLLSLLQKEKVGVALFGLGRVGDAHGGAAHGGDSQRDGLEIKPEQRWVFSHNRRRDNVEYVVVRL